jgi:hypothetical protein
VAAGIVKGEDGDITGESFVEDGDGLFPFVSPKPLFPPRNASVLSTIPANYIPNRSQILGNTSTTCLYIL